MFTGDGRHMAIELHQHPQSFPWHVAVHFLVAAQHPTKTQGSDPPPQHNKSAPVALWTHPNQVEHTIKVTHTEHLLPLNLSS